MSTKNTKDTRVFLALPGYGHREDEVWDATLDALTDADGPSVHAYRSQWSLLAHNFNDCFARCINEGRGSYFAMLHADMGVSSGWLRTMLAELNHGDYDVMHVPAAIKNHDGITSTAISYEDDEWSVVRRLTMKELHELPETFGIEEIREHIDGQSLFLLPNTGCIIMRLGDWCKDFPGFEIKDRLRIDEDGTLKADVVPEDWNFGYWCGRHGLKVGATRKVVTCHFGRIAFANNKVWGVEIDTHWADQQAATTCHQ